MGFKVDATKEVIVNKVIWVSDKQSAYKTCCRKGVCNFNG